MSTTTAPPSAARDRLLATAADLFYREGIHGVGVDRVLVDANVTRATMYRHFAGKEALVAAYLEREDEAIRASVAATAAETDDPRELLERVVDGIADDAQRYHTRGCPFINAAAEYPDPASEVRGIVAAHRAWFRTTLVDVLTRAGSADPEGSAAVLVLLRDAMLVGNSLDGASVREPFVRAARAVIA